MEKLFGLPEWRVSKGLVDYPVALEEMERRVAAIHENQARELIWLLEHPPIYTAGVSAKIKDLKTEALFPVYETGRGGQYTYHGPGQRVVYVMLDLRKRGRDIRRFVRSLEDWSVAALAEFGISGHRRSGQVGIWVSDKENLKQQDKIAAIGIRLRRWVSYHGMSINLAPDLSHYRGIVPCGIRDQGVTSFERLGVFATLRDLDDALWATRETCLATGTV